MAELDPRSQLYTVTYNKLEQISAAFLDSPHAEKYQWNNSFDTVMANVPSIEFTDPESTIKADHADVFGIYSPTKHEIRIPLNLFADGSPYCREQDYESNTAYDVVLLPDTPPVIFPLHVYMRRSQNVNDLFKLVKTGVAETLGKDRAANILATVRQFDISMMDFESMDWVKFP